jgi:catalase
LSGAKQRVRSEKFFDFFSQATLFFRSQSAPEQQHIIQALQFELGKVERVEIRERMLRILSQIDERLASSVAAGLGLAVPGPDGLLNHGVPADANPADYQPRPSNPPLPRSEALSMANTPKDSIKTRKVALLVADGVDDESLTGIQQTLTGEGAVVKVIAPHGGTVKTAGGQDVKVDFTFLTASSVLFDAVFVPDGAESVTALQAEPKAVHWINEAYNHCKAIGASGAGANLLCASALGAEILSKPGVSSGEQPSDGGAPVFIRAIAAHRHWSREQGARVPA